MEPKGQVWLETVIYILIGLTIIGLVLGFVTPKINEKRDRIVIEQSVAALNVFDSKIKEVIESGIYNKRVLEFKMQRGNLYVDSQKNQVVFFLDGLTAPYSEPSINIPLGRVILKTTQGRKTSAVNLTLQYGAGTDITFDGTQDMIKINPSAVPYKFSFENKGVSAGAYVIDIVRLS